MLSADLSVCGGVLAQVDDQDAAAEGFAQGSLLAMPQPTKTKTAQQAARQQQPQQRELQRQLAKQEVLLAQKDRQLAQQEKQLAEQHSQLQAARREVAQLQASQAATAKQRDDLQKFSVGAKWFVSRRSHFIFYYRIILLQLSKTTNIVNG